MKPLTRSEYFSKFISVSHSITGPWCGAGSACGDEPARKPGPVQRDMGASPEILKAEYRNKKAGTVVPALRRKSLELLGRSVLDVGKNRIATG